MSKKAIVAISAVLLFIVVPGSSIILAILVATGVLIKLPVRIRRWAKVFCKKLH